MNDFYYDLCPQCQATGTIDFYRLPVCDPNATVRLETRTCGCCDGEGKIKIPTGFVLTPSAEYSTITTSGTWPGIET